MTSLSERKRETYRLEWSITSWSFRERENENVSQREGERIEICQVGWRKREIQRRLEHYKLVRERERVNEN